MRLIDADALKKMFKLWDSMSLYNGPERHIIRAAIIEVESAPTIDAIPIDWMLQRMNETSSGSGMNVELNNALFAVGVERERWKKEHEVIVYEEVVVHYCPVCGRKLKGD